MQREIDGIRIHLQLKEENRATSDLTKEYFGGNVQLVKAPFDLEETYERAQTREEDAIQELSDHYSNELIFCLADSGLDRESQAEKKMVLIDKIASVFEYGESFSAAEFHEEMTQEIFQNLPFDCRLRNTELIDEDASKNNMILIKKY